MEHLSYTLLYILILITLYRTDKLIKGSVLHQTIQYNMPIFAGQWEIMHWSFQPNSIIVKPFLSLNTNQKPCSRNPIIWLPDTFPDPMPKKQVNSLLSKNQTLISQTTANLLSLHIDNDIKIKSCKLGEIHSMPTKWNLKHSSTLLMKCFNSICIFESCFKSKLSLWSWNLAFF